MISKRFEFSSSHRLHVTGWSEQQDEAVYGREARSPHGHGHNYVATFAFNGPVDQQTGMMINVTVIKDRLKEIIDGRYDHKYINDDVPVFKDVVPTAENISCRLLEEARPLFKDTAARPVVCHLTESPSSEATAYDGGKVERHLWTNFSAARRTYSPHLSDHQNEQHFGRASSVSGHGHHYRLRATIKGEVDRVHGMIFPEKEARRILGELHDKLDHRNLSTDVPEFRDMPMTTEMLARYFYEYLGSRLPIERVKLFENDDFFVEYLGNNRWLMAVADEFHASHRLHSDKLCDADNLNIFGKCNNPRGHGHLYRVESTIGGAVEPDTGTLYRLDSLRETVNSQLDGWNYKHLNLDTDDFKGRNTTGENIIDVLWSKLSLPLGDRLHRLRLWETPNNRFTLRRTVKDFKKGEV